MTTERRRPGRATPQPTVRHDRSRGHRQGTGPSRTAASSPRRASPAPEAVTIASAALTREQAPWRWSTSPDRSPPLSEEHAAARYWAGSWRLPVFRTIAPSATRDPRRWAKAPVDKSPRTLGTGTEHRRVARSLDEIDSLWGEVDPRWGSRASCGIGLATGPIPGWPRGCLALDVDDVEAFRAWLDGRRPPVTLTWTSGRPDRRSATLLYAYPEDATIRSRTRVLPGLDTRGVDGHVVLPGSVHWTGSRYRVVRVAPIAPLPTWLLEELLAAERAAAARKVSVPPSSATATPSSRLVASSSAARPPALTPEAWQVGQRNAVRLFRRACSAVSWLLSRVRGARGEQGRDRVERRWSDREERTAASPGGVRDVTADTCSAPVRP